MNSKRVAIVQSNYIPWKGYFDLIASVDEFILYDDMQYTRRDWRNRNKIKTPRGLEWLTIPVRVSGKYHQKIRDTEIDGSAWVLNHWRVLEQNYAKSKCFKEISAWLYPLYFDTQYIKLSDLNKAFIVGICWYLGIATKITCSSDFILAEGKSERLADLAMQVGASEYISGPAAQSYIDQRIFENMGIKLTWFNYDGYRKYPQLWGDFTDYVTILDLLFNCGVESRKFMKINCL